LPVTLTVVGLPPLLLLEELLDELLEELLEPPPLLDAPPLLEAPPLLDPLEGGGVVGLLLSLLQPASATAPSSARVAAAT
jgi:hypothetical protein